MTTDVQIEARQEADPPEGSKLLRLLKATFLGLCGGILGAAIWFGLWYWRPFNLWVLIAIGVGCLVGLGVRRGSNGRRGAGYQILAVVLTYIAIGLAQVPQALFPSRPSPGSGERAVRPANTSPGVTERDSTDDDETPAPKKPLTADRLLLMASIYLGPLIYIIVTAPAKVAFSGILNALSAGIGLWAAWKLNSIRRIIPASKAPMPPSPS